MITVGLSDSRSWPWNTDDHDGSHHVVNHGGVERTPGASVFLVPPRSARSAPRFAHVTALDLARILPPELFADAG